MQSFSKHLSALIRFIGNQVEGSPWSKIINQEVGEGILKLEKLCLEEADVILSLIEGGELSMLSTGDLGITDKDEQVIVLGYCSYWIDYQDLDRIKPVDFKKLKLAMSFSDPNQKVIALSKDPQTRSRQEIVVLDPT